MYIEITVWTDTSCSSKTVKIQSPITSKKIDEEVLQWLGTNVNRIYYEWEEVCPHRSTNEIRMTENVMQTQIQ